MKKNKKMGFIEGAMIIALAGVLVKIIGAVFKIPLDSYVLKTDGMALYNTSYTIYNLLFVISTAGLPTAISKLVAESDSRGDYDGSKKILKVSLLLLFGIGALGSLALGLGSKFFSGLIGYPDAYLTMIAMSPSLFFVAGMSAFRGYFQGQGNMLPTAISEVIEALCKLFVGLSLAYALLPIGKMFASAGAIMGVTVGSVLAFCFLLIYYLSQKKNEKKSEKSKAPTKRVLINIVKIAVPITLGVSVFTLTSFIDTAMVTNQMKGYIATSNVAEESVISNLNEERMEYYKNIPLSISEDGEAEKTEKIKENKAAFIYGYLGRSITLFNMPAVIISAIATSVVPAIAAANAERDKKKSRSFTKSALLIAIVLALPCAVGMSILAKPILSLIFHDGSFSVLLNVMGIAVLFLTLVQIINALLQSWGKVWIPVVNMLIGGAVKILVNLILVSRPEINIMGAPVGTLLCYVTVATLNIIALCKYSEIKPDIKGFILKPVFCVLVMGIFTFGSQYFISVIAGEKLAMFISIAISAMIYFVAIVLTKTLKKEEILLLPKGEKISSVMEKYHLI